MHRVQRTLGRPPRTIALAQLACLAVSAMPAFGQEEADGLKIPTIYREACKRTLAGKADANGTSSTGM